MLVCSSKCWGLGPLKFLFYGLKPGKFGNHYFRSCILAVLTGGVGKKQDSMVAFICSSIVGSVKFGSTAGNAWFKTEGEGREIDS